ncbi:MAG: hypothetical protein ACYS7Y_03975 [Planctomycetota bacterium]|jgi:hypothetical protein
MTGRPWTLDEYREQIGKNAPWVDRKSHSHNIINLCLLAINENFGKEEANKAIDDYNLEELGWEKE